MNLKAQFSDGLGSEFLVINAKTREIVTGAFILFPIHDRESFNTLALHNDPSIAGRIEAIRPVWSEKPTGE